MDEKDKQIEALTLRVKTLTEENATLTTKNQSQATDLVEAGKVVEDLKTQLAEKKAGTVELPTVTVDKVTYQLTSPFFFDGQEVTIDVLKENTKLAAKVVKEKVGNLVKVEK